MVLHKAELTADFDLTVEETGILDDARGMKKAISPA
jgi:hypothetical protein